MSQKERQRYHLLQMVLDGKNNLKDASKRMRVSYRHAKWLKKRLVTEGAKGLAHRNRGRASPKALNHEVAERIIDLSEDKYSNFNDTHFTEKLKEIEGITVGHDTVRRLRRSNGIKPKRRRRAKKHFKRRSRKSQEGMMVLWDGSPHRWFGKEEPLFNCCLRQLIRNG